MDANTTRELPKIRKALDRIADACEGLRADVGAYTSADPLTLLNAALQGDEIAGDETPRHPLMPDVEPQGWFASNGATYIYRHPTEGYEVVLRPDPVEPGGYAATIEEA